MTPEPSRISHLGLGVLAGLAALGAAANGYIALFFLVAFLGMLAVRNRRG